MTLIRFILFVILIYLLFKIAKNFLKIFTPPKPEVKGEPKEQSRQFKDDEIEDIDFKEVDRKHGEEKSDKTD